MSDTMQNNQNPNPTGTNGVPQNDAKNANQQPAKVNPIMAGLRRVKQKVSEGWNEIKSHPITHGLMALGGTALGGYVTYKVTSSMASSAPAPVQPPVLIPETTSNEDEEANTSTNVEFVDIPETTTTEE